jgi:prepilin peptidase CpaA
MPPDWLDPPGLLLGLYVALFVLCAAWDVLSLKIPNALVAVLVVLFGVAAYRSPGDLSIWLHILVAVVALSAAAAAFRFGMVGGGDAKLFAVAALWAGDHSIASYLLVLGIAGFAAALLFATLRSLVQRLPSGAAGALVGRRHFPKALLAGANIPYAVPIAAASIWVARSLPLFG